MTCKTGVRGVELVHAASEPEGVSVRSHPLTQSLSSSVVSHGFQCASREPEAKL